MNFAIATKRVAIALFFVVAEGERKGRERVAEESRKSRERVVTGKENEVREVRENGDLKSYP